MKMVLLLFGLLLAVVFGIVFFQSDLKKNLPFPFFEKNPTLTIKNHTFTILVAKTPQEKEVGLSEKTSLPQNSGMLFPFEKADYYSFWMKNMKISVDIIYINKDKIVTIIENAQAPKSPEDNLQIFRPDEPADKVLEINAGLSKKYGFKNGDGVKIENL
ncbi:MAG: DUF192 domain-containing protein [Candidatus Levybacteria bacterium]|nr:DUF192 domain-containing protein [Candidatus Levybacteria bacterium]